MRNFLVNVSVAAQATTTFTVRAESEEHAGALAQLLLEHPHPDHVVHQNKVKISDARKLAWSLGKTNLTNPILEIVEEARHG